MLFRMLDKNCDILIKFVGKLFKTRSIFLLSMTSNSRMRGDRAIPQNFNRNQIKKLGYLTKRILRLISHGMT